MKILKYLLLAIPVSLISCGDDDEGSGTPSSTFTVTIENVDEPEAFFQSGIFNTPDGASEPGPVMPGSGDSYSFSFYAGPAYLPMTETKLSFTTMLVASNDLFFAPKGEGIDLYDDNGNPISGDITDQVYLWDAGTEINREPGSSDQPGPGNEPAGSGTDEGGNVTLLEESGGEIPVTIINDMGGEETFNYPAVSELIKVTISNDGTLFTVTIENPSETSSQPSPLSPGGYAIHVESDPFFTAGESEMDNGIEEIAEDGMPGNFSSFLEENTGLTIPLSPGVYAVHESGSMPLFTAGEADLGEGLEAIAEDGIPADLANALMGKATVSTSAAFDTPVGASGPAAIGPGGSYEFSFEASPEDRLSLATMFVQSNDWFYSFSEEGLALYDGDEPISGDVTGSVSLYDAGTEVDEVPGAGLNQVIRQSALDTGPADIDGTVRTVTDSDLPDVSSVIKITVTNN